MKMFSENKILVMESSVFLILVAISAPINSFPSGSGKKIANGILEYSKTNQNCLIKITFYYVTRSIKNRKHKL